MNYEQLKALEALSALFAPRLEAKPVKPVETHAIRIGRDRKVKTFTVEYKEDRR